MKTKILLTTLAAAAAIFSQAQVTLTGRLSTLEYDYLYGWHGDVVQDRFSSSSSDLLASDSMASYFYSDSWSGGYGWWAFVEETMDNSYSISGELDDVRAISGAGTTQIEAGCDQESLSQMRSYNGVTFNFSVAREQRYVLTGTLDWAGYALDPGNQTQLRIERWNGAWWDIVYWTPTMPDGRGAFSTRGILPPGEYRIWCNLLERAFGNETKEQSYSFVLSFIKRPIPLPRVGG